MEVYDVVKKLIGPIDAIGETNADEKRLENLGSMMLLVDALLGDIIEASKGRHRDEASMKVIGNKASAYLFGLELDLLRVDPETGA